MALANSQRHVLVCTYRDQSKPVMTQNDSAAPGMAGLGPISLPDTSADGPWEASPPDGRGQGTAGLRVYLGYAPGVGKTYAMLHEGRRRKTRGTDVVVGWVETYDRPGTVEATRGLEVLPPQLIDYRGVSVPEMDLEGIIARHPLVALVDELAHTNVLGARNRKRYQDVLELQANGISVISTVNVQHLASLQDTVQLLTGATVTETLPNWVLESADELEMVDQSPQALQKRLRHGNVVPQDQVSSALNGFFRIDTLAALREITLRCMADHTDRKLRDSQGGARTVPQDPILAETVLVCVPPSGVAQQLVRRGAHLAERLNARLVVLHVHQPNRGLDSQPAADRQEALKALHLAGALGAEVITRDAQNVADSLVQEVHRVGATQIVLGESTHSRLRELMRGSVVRDVLKRTKDVDVHIVRRVDG